MWYGVCQNVTATSHKLYCSYNGTAKKLDDDGRRLLSQYCPHLLNDTGDTLTCCDAEQVNFANFFFSLTSKYIYTVN